MQLDDESWSDRATDSPLPSAGPSIGFAGEGHGEGPPEQDLMAFLCDFRGAFSGDGPTEAERTESASPLLRVADELAGDAQDWRGDPYLGSEVQVDPTWWLASDRRWYPPELHPDRIEEAAIPPLEEPVPAADAGLPAAASRPDQPGRRPRFLLGRPRAGRLAPSVAPA